jgi:hypothetical protein
MPTNKKQETSKTKHFVLLKFTFVYNIFFWLILGSAIYGQIAGGTDRLLESSPYFYTLLLYVLVLPLLSFFNSILITILLARHQLKGTIRTLSIIMLGLSIYFILNFVMYTFLYNIPLFHFFRHFVLE